MSQHLNPAPLTPSYSPQWAIVVPAHLLLQGPCYNQPHSPSILSESSVDSKYTVLAEGVYTYFETVYGSVKVRHRHRNRQSKRQSKLAQQVKEAKALKTEARRELLQARRSTTISQEQVGSIAKRFFQSVRAHSKVRRADRSARMDRSKEQPITNVMAICGGLQETCWMMMQYLTFSQPSQNLKQHRSSLPSTNLSHSHSPSPLGYHRLLLQQLISMKKTSLWLR